MLWKILNGAIINVAIKHTKYRKNNKINNKINDKINNKIYKN